jgi:hypothetical protein
MSHACLGTERLYKWLLPDRTTPNTHKPWPVEDLIWTPRETPVLCKSGWHAMEEKDVLAHMPARIGAVLYEVEVDGEVEHGTDKLCAETMRFTYLVGVTTERNLRLFAADCAEDVLPLFEVAYPNDNRVRDCIAVARRFAEGQATRQELAAARSAVWASAAGYAARYAAADAAAGAAARDATLAAGDAAWAAGYAARYAARAKYSNWLVVRIESDK